MPTSSPFRCSRTEARCEKRLPQLCVTSRRSTVLWFCRAGPGICRAKLSQATMRSARTGCLRKNQSFEGPANRPTALPDAPFSLSRWLGSTKKDGRGLSDLCQRGLQTSIYLDPRIALGAHTTSIPIRHMNGFLGIRVLLQGAACSTRSPKLGLPAPFSE